MKSTKGRGRKLGTVAKLRDARNGIMELQGKVAELAQERNHLRLVVEQLRQDAAKTANTISDATDRPREDLDAERELRRVEQREHAKTVREQRDQIKALLDLSEKLIAVIALPAGPEHAVRRAAVLVEALTATRAFHPFD